MKIRKNHLFSPVQVGLHEVKPAVHFEVKTEE
ncbi:hypothetical protein NIES2107_03080 [Nostoc carneum NIES-2107]|nr:hypothetical protein NIES2107_03080 [Nostoc carneum NIES-2107]